MDLIDEEYLLTGRFNEQELADRGGEVIPPQAAKLIREAQVMQQIEKPYVVSILRENLQQELAVKQVSAGANHVMAVAVNGFVFSWGDN